MTEHNNIDNDNKMSQFDGIKIDHNVSDIIPPELEKNSNNKGKGLLTILALLIAILIIAIMMGKMVLEENDANKTLEESKSETIVSPDLQLDNSIKESKEEKEELDELSKVIGDGSDSSQNDIKPETAEIDEEKSNIIEVTPKEEVVEKETETVVDRPAVEPKEQVAVPTQTPSIETPKPQERKVERERSVEKSHISSGTYYIQVGSFSTQPSSQFLQIIKKNGFSYKLHASGKLLVGPYSSRAVAGKDLPRVKDRINKGAFVINMK